jgi:hypothetical protein
MDFLTNLNTQEEAIAQPKKPIEFTVKPTGELKFKGVPDADTLHRLVASSDYLADSDRRANQQIQIMNNKAADRINLLTICFLGASFLLAIASIFWSYNSNSNSNQRGIVNESRGFVRGSCQ